MSQPDPTATDPILDPPLEESQFALSLMVGTVVASPVIWAALTGRQSVTSALGLYLLAIVGSWLCVGLVGGAFTLVGPESPDPSTDDEDLAESETLEPLASAPTAAATSESGAVGSLR